MTIAEWSNDLSVGIEKIDNQHRELIRLLNDLGDAFNSPNRQSVAEVCLMKMRDYMEQHFSDEEKLMEDADYPEISTQKKEHKRFRDKVALYEIGKIISYTPYQDMLDFLKRWFTNHFKTHDKKLADYLAGQA